MENNNLSGVMPALVTPFTAQSEVDLRALEKLAAYELEKGADGFYLCGTTGQGLWMNTDERRTVTDTVLKAVDGAVPVIVHVGSVAPTEAAKLAVHAVQTGASAISSTIPPSYTNLESISAYFDMLSAHAPELPLLPYFIGAPITPIDIMEHLSGVPNLAGTKYTGPNMYEMTRIIEMRDAPWSVFSGMDEQCVFAAMCGAGGAIGSSINIMVGVYKTIRALVAEGNHQEAYRLQRRANKIITLLITYGYSGALKAALRMLGFECGQPRLPELPFDPAKQIQLEADLKALDFEELSSM